MSKVPRLLVSRSFALSLSPLCDTKMNINNWNKMSVFNLHNTVDVLEEGDYDAEFEAEVDPVLTEQEETVAFADVYRNTIDDVYDY